MTRVRLDMRAPAALERGAVQRQRSSFEGREIVTATCNNVMKLCQLYDKFEGRIKELYDKFEGNEKEGLRLDVPALENYLMTSFRDTIGVPLQTLDTDFFTAGVDSLKAIQMRRMIQKSLDLDGKRLGPNVVYEKGNAKELARHLFGLRKGERVQEVDEFSLMRKLIDKYSGFQKHQYLTGGTNGYVPNPKGQSVV